MTILINPGTGPVTYDKQGHVLGGGERLEDVQLDEVTQRALELGHLRQLDDKGSAAEPAEAEETKPAETGEAKPAKSASRDTATPPKDDEAKPATPARRNEKS